MKDDPDFTGSLSLLAKGARPLVSIEAFLVDVGLKRASIKKRCLRTTSPVGEPSAPQRRRPPPDDPLLRATEEKPLHIDEIAERACVPLSHARASLLTLALENVVVEGPPGFFRRV